MYYPNKNNMCETSRLLLYRAIEPVSAIREGIGEEPIAESREGRVPDQVL